MRKILFLTSVFLLPVSYFLFAQDDLMKMIDTGTPVRQPVIATFKTTRIINAHSNETVKGKTLDFRITHRFGDMGGKNANLHTGYGMYQIQDVRIAFEYGITDRLTAAFGKSKANEFIDGHLKFRLLQQTTDNKSPLAITLLTAAAFTTREADKDSTSEFSYKNNAQRLSYATQVIIARKFGDYLSLAILPTYVHRNYVAFDDENGILALGIGGRLRFTRSAALIADYYYNLSKMRQKKDSGFYNPLAIGFELETGGHVFHVIFTNATGIIENVYIPYTMTTWLNGQFRWGFNISRVFSFGK